MAQSKRFPAVNYNRDTSMSLNGFHCEKMFLIQSLTKWRDIVKNFFNLGKRRGQREKTFQFNRKYLQD